MERLTREQVIEKLNKGEKDFKELDLSGLDLSKLDLSNAILFHCDLKHINLSCCNLKYANLEYADLSHCDLKYADLSYTNLHDADLSHSYLYMANLSNANLEGASLSYANLSKADLSNANLSYAYFSDAKLWNTRLDEKEQIRKGLILKESMIGYKKCADDVIVTLEIPKGAIVFSINNYSCRTNKAKVIEISNGETIVNSKYFENFSYELGKEIEIEDFGLMYDVDDAPGIHFFKTREEAEKY